MENHKSNVEYQSVLSTFKEKLGELAYLNKTPGQGHFARWLAAGGVGQSTIRNWLTDLISAPERDEAIERFARKLLKKFPSSRIVVIEWRNILALGLLESIGVDVTEETAESNKFISLDYLITENKHDE